MLKAEYLLYRMLKRRIMILEAGGKHGKIGPQNADGHSCASTFCGTQLGETWTNHSDNCIHHNLEKFDTETKSILDSDVKEYQFDTDYA